jgi:hypothetical protein
MLYVMARYFPSTANRYYSIVQEHLMPCMKKVIYWSEIIIIMVIFSGTAAQRGLWPPRLRGFVITHNDAPQSVGLLRTSDQLVAETST